MRHLSSCCTRIAAAWALAVTLSTVPAHAGVVVRYQPCDPPSQGGTEVCASDARLVPTQTWFSGFGGSVVAGGHAGPTTLGAELHNTAGGAASVTATFWDDYTLLGPAGGAPVSFNAWLHLDGSWQHGDRFSTSAAALGFLINDHTSWPAPASVLVQFPGGVGGEPVDLSVHRALALAVGDTIRLGFQLHITGSDETRLDFGSTATLSFPDLPPGYAIRSTQGFDGVGSAPGGPGSDLPEPGTAWLGLAALAMGAGLRARARAGSGVEGQSADDPRRPAPARPVAIPRRTGAARRGGRADGGPGGRRAAGRLQHHAPA